MAKTSPFDKKSENKDLPILKLLFHTESFSKDILAGNTNDIIKLIKLFYSKEIKIFFTPSKSQEIIDFFAQYNIEIPLEYKLYEDGRGTYLKYSFKKDVYISELSYKQLFDNIQENSKVKRIEKNDLFEIFKIDYLILNKSDSYFGKDKNVLSIEQTFEYIRVLLTHNNIFMNNVVLINNTVPVPCYVNEGFYYLYRYRKVFHEYNNAWSIVTYTGISGDGSFSPIFSQFDSLSTRLNFICRALDKIIYFSLKEPNNDTTDNILYHLGYFVMLITGVFDDLAWIINNLYSLFDSETERTKIVLKDRYIRKTNQRVVNDFANNLKNKNNDLYNFLTDEKTRDLIYLFYPIRDTLQHRAFVGSYIYSYYGEETIKMSMFNIDSESAELMKKLSSDNGKEWGLHIREKFSINSYDFTNQAFKTISYLTNSILSKIDWSDYLINQTVEIKAKIEKSKEQIKSGLWHMYDWAEEPIYF